MVFMHVNLVSVVLHVLVHPHLIVLAVTNTGDKILIRMVLFFLTGKVSSNLLPIKSKRLVVNKFLSKKEVMLSKVHASKNVVMVTIEIETVKNANHVALCVKLASMILIIVLHQKLVNLNSWVDSMMLVHKVCKLQMLLLAKIHGNSVVVLKIVLLTLVSLKKNSTKNSVGLVQITLTGFSKKSENAIVLLKNVQLH
jgi:hypothetical protein